jgi:hypothetical protein
MAATGATPISLYYSATASNTPTAGNLVNGELAINITDGKIFYKDNAGVVQTIASKAGNVNVSSFSGGTTGLTPNTATTGAVTLAGTLAVANGGTGSTTSTGSGSVVLQTSPSITTPTIDKINTSVTNTSLGAGDASLMKNRIINGAMVIDQRNAGAAVTTDGSFPVDRFFCQITYGSLSLQQNSTAPAGFVNSTKITVSSGGSVGVNDRNSYRQNIEGYNVADLGYGGASAKTVTLSFWVYSSLTGTFSGALQNSAQDRSYVFSYSIPSANTWTQISVTVAGDTTGTWLKTNGIGLSVWFDLGTGSNRQTTAGSWTAGDYRSATGSVALSNTTGATWYVTGVQLEVGSSATGFEYRQYQQELALCQRYCVNYKSSDGGIYMRYGSGYANSGTNLEINVPFPTAMRTQPSLTVTGTPANYAIYVAGGVNVCSTNPAIDNSSKATLVATVNANTASSFSSSGGGSIISNNNSSSYMLFTAEL